LAYASPRGRAFLDRELYLPERWTDEPARCRAARVPEQVQFRTKPELAQLMLERALDAGVPAAWVTADEVYGGSPGLREWLQERQMPYVLAVKCSELLEVSSPNEVVRERAEQLAAAVPPEQWIACSAGHGAKGRRLYAWTRLQLATPATASMARWLLVRRSRSDGELAFYACFGPAATSLVGLVRVAGTRWAVEMVFPQLTKGRVRAVGWGWQHVADLHLAVGHDHPVDEQFDQQPSLGERRRCQPRPDGLAERLDPIGDGTQLEALLGDGVQLALLGQQRGAAAVQLLPLMLQLRQLHHLGEVGVQQPLLLALQLAQGLAEGRLAGLEFLG
jgi:hypothetical protein